MPLDDQRLAALQNLLSGIRQSPPVAATRAGVRPLVSPALAQTRNGSQQGQSSGPDCGKREQTMTGMAAGRPRHPAMTASPAASREPECGRPLIQSEDLHRPCGRLGEQVDPIDPRIGKNKSRNDDDCCCDQQRSPNLAPLPPSGKIEQAHPGCHLREESGCPGARVSHPNHAHDGELQVDSAGVELRTGEGNDKSQSSPRGPSSHPRQARLMA